MGSLFYGIGAILLVVANFVPKEASQPALNVGLALMAAGAYMKASD